MHNAFLTHRERLLENKSSTYYVVVRLYCVPTRRVVVEIDTEL